jgi:hypothetical protein
MIVSQYFSPEALTAVTNYKGMNKYIASHYITLIIFAIVGRSVL